MEGQTPLLQKIRAQIYRFAPVQRDKIVFDNIMGRGFGENPKYIAEEIARRGLKVRMIWLLSDMSAELPPYLEKIEYGTPRAKYEIHTAGFLIDNVRRKWIVPKKKNQVYLQTWHGGYAMKTIEKDAASRLPQDYVKQAQEDGLYCDAIVADGLQAEQIYRSSFWLKEDCEILKTGTPRCDILINQNGNPEIRKKVCAALGADASAYLVLYAPTFRNSGSTDGYIQDFSRIQTAFEASHGKTTVLVRLHPNIAKQAASLYTFENGSLVNASLYPDPQELVLAADTLVTDYSSIAFDFALIQKPVFLFRKDLAAYRAERELYEIFNDLPFPSGENEQALIEAIGGFSNDQYKVSLEAFYQEYPSYNIGTAAAQIVDWLMQKGLR
jgi:CDP-glycerol glycerophosphotransferase